MEDDDGLLHLSPSDMEIDSCLDSDSETLVARSPVPQLSELPAEAPEAPGSSQPAGEPVEQVVKSTPEVPGDDGSASPIRSEQQSSTSKEIGEATASTRESSFGSTDWRLRGETSLEWAVARRERGMDPLPGDADLLSCMASDSSTNQIGRAHV